MPSTLPKPCTRFTFQVVWGAASTACVFQLLALTPSPSAGSCVLHCVDVGNTLVMSHNGSHCHHFKVNLTSDPSVVGVTFQIHTQSRNVVLTTSLSLPYDNTTNGTHVGLVQFRSGGQQWAEFYATFEQGATNKMARALIAAVPIRKYGECSDGRGQ